MLFGIHKEGKVWSTRGRTTSCRPASEWRGGKETPSGTHDSACGIDGPGYEDPIKFDGRKDEEELAFTAGEGVESLSLPESGESTRQRSTGGVMTSCWPVRR